MSERKCEWRKTTNEEQQQNKDENQHHKNLTGGFPKQVPSLGVFDFEIITKLIITTKIITKLIITEKFLYKRNLKN